MTDGSADRTFLAVLQRQPQSLCVIVDGGLNKFQLRLCDFDRTFGLRKLNRLNLFDGRRIKPLSRLKLFERFCFIFHLFTKALSILQLTKQRREYALCRISFCPIRCQLFDVEFLFRFDRSSQRCRC